MIEEMKFKDFIKLKRGYDLPNHDMVDGEIPVVASTSIKGYHNKHKVLPPLVATGRSGSLGKVQYLTVPSWPLNTSLYVKDFKGNNPKYVYYFLKMMHLENFNSGAGVPTLNQNHLHNLRIKVHHKNLQSKIAEALSKYDKLIENNFKRINILEQMAEQLYKEWFVRMRFPNYENTKQVKGIPEGWSYEKLEEQIEIFRGKSYSSKQLRDYSNLPMINLKNINRDGGYRRDGLKFFEGKYSKNNEAFQGDIVMAVTDMTQNREVVGRVAKVPNIGVTKFIISMDLIRLVPKKFPHVFMYSFFRFSGIGHHLKQFANGANVLHLNPKAVLDQKPLWPDIKLARNFAQIVEPFLEEVELLNQQIENLRKTRDLLLPRLISGKLKTQQTKQKVVTDQKEVIPFNQNSGIKY